ncbi:acyl-CoA dehydrogenase, partial [Pseudomonas syringae pv. tagetis]
NDDGSLRKRNDELLPGLFHKMGRKANTTTAMNYGENREYVGNQIGKPQQGNNYMYKNINEAQIEQDQSKVMHTKSQ